MQISKYFKELRALFLFEEQRLAIYYNKLIIVFKNKIKLQVNLFY